MEEVQSHMKANRMTSRWLWKLIAVVLLLAFTAWPASLRSESNTPDPLAMLPQLAKGGQFDRVLDLLKAQGHGQLDTPVASLISDLQLYQKHESDRHAAMAIAYRSALDEMAEHLDADDLEKAMVSAIDARGLSSDPQATLEESTVKTLIAQTQDAAQEAEQNNEWLEALSLYRSLDLLFNDPARYRDQIKRATQHLRVLRLYAPEQLKKLYTERAKRLGKEKTTPLHFDDESWEQKLSGIRLSMLRQTLAQAARRHVGDQGYDPLVRGAIENIITLIDTRGLEQTFASLENAKLRDKFRSRIIELRKSLDQRSRTLNFLDTASIIDRVMAINDRTIDLPDEVIIYELAEGATDPLDDFSTVIWPNETESFNRNTQGKFSGVGIQISLRDDRLIVVSPLEDTPAQRAGIKAGDIIATVDNRDTSTWSLDRAVRKITGPKGTPVVLGIERAGNPDLIDFTLIRAEIVIESIRGWQRKQQGGWDYLIDPDQRIGYVRLSQFIPQSANDLDKAINEMEVDGPINGLILDLRFNPGGLLSASVEVSDRFISSGPIVSTVGPDGKQTSQFRARADHTHTPIPTIVLINEGSASASEIVSGALQDYQRAVILGTRSFGKGSVQDLFPLSGDKAYLKLTTQYYMLPGGRIIHRKPDSKTWGIEPDLIVDMTAKQMADALEFRQKVDVLRNDSDEATDDKEPLPKAYQIITDAMDPQLEAALIVIKTQIVAQQLVLAQGDDWKSNGP